MSAASVHPIVVLIVEDNRGDVVFFQEAAEASQTAADLHAVTNGVDALRFLRKEPPFQRAPRPDIVVLDLNLPLTNGEEVMAQMASDPDLSTIPVAILTTSSFDTLLADLLPLGRCLYFTKTDDFERLQDIVRKIAAHARSTQRRATASA
jgi:two-component system response regulator